MHRRRGRLVGTVGVAAVVIAGCTSSGAQPGDDPTTASVSPTVGATSGATASPTPSETGTASEDPFAMPDPVTKEYVDRVVNTIYEEWGAITREILEEPADPVGVVPVQTRERIAELFAGEYLLRRLEEADAVLRGQRENFLPIDEHSSVQWRTRRVYVASDHCLVAAGDFDTSGTAVESISLLTAISLTPAEDNGTGWRITDALANTDPDGEVLDDSVMIDAQVSDFGDLLVTTCRGDQG